MSTTDAARDASPEPKPTTETPSELDLLIDRHAPVALPIATVALAGVAGYVQGAGAAILVLAGGALVGGIAVFWSSLRTLFGETPLTGADAYAIGAPRTEEEQKRAVLRALKDLEFEHGVGKISEEDYQALVAQYRAEAKRLLRLLDDDAKPRRAEVEALIERRLRKAGLLDDKSEPASDEAREAADAVAKRAASAPVAAPAGKPLRSKKKKGEKARGPVCSSCGTTNDADAAFCKKCGARQGTSARDEDAKEPEAAPAKPAPEDDDEAEAKAAADDGDDTDEADDAPKGEVKK
jgi:hypothetical protein